MKIGLVLDRFDPEAGGLERWTVGFARYLRGQGHDPVALAFDAMADPPVPVVRLPTLRLPPGRTLLARANAAQEGVAALTLDTVLDTGTGWSADVFMPCTGSRRWSQRQLIRTQPWPRRLRAVLSPRSRSLDRAMRRIEAEQIRRARRIIAVSALVRDLLVRQHGLDPARITVIPNGVDTARFAPERIAGHRAATRAGLGLADEILFLGSAHNMWLKGMDTAIAALSRLGAHAHLALAGAVPDRRWTRLADAAPGRVHFLGPVTDMAPVFAAADALVHPTRWDACSLSTIEAGAAGLPVITTSRNGAAELITEGRTGYILRDPDNVEALTDRMRRLLDPVQRRIMGAAAQAASAQHDVAQNYAAVLDVLRDTCR